MTWGIGAGLSVWLAFAAPIRAQAPDAGVPTEQPGSDEAAADDLPAPDPPEAESVDGVVETGEAAAAPAVEVAAGDRSADEAPLPEQPDERARALYQRGQRYYEEGRYDEAVADFREAYELSGRPLLQFNIANALERAGSYRSAADALRRYRGHAPESEREVLDRRLESLERRIAIRDHEALPAPPPTPPEPELIPAWILFSAAGAFAIAGSAFGIAALNARDEVEQGCTVTAGRRICTASAESALDRDSTFSVLTDVGFGLAVASAAGAVVWILLELDREAPVSVDVAGSGVRVDVAF